jgi:DNA-binding NarL/FixJ family response regulator
VDQFEQDFLSREPEAGRDHPNRPPGLTTRQQEILGLLRDGLSNAEIARRLFISPKTVEHHVSAVLAKMAAPTRKSAVSRAVRLGLVAAPR